MSKSQTITIGGKEIVIEFTGENISHQAGATSLDFYGDKIGLLRMLKANFYEIKGI